MAAENASDLIALVERDYTLTERSSLRTLRFRAKHLRRLLPADRLPTAADLDEYMATRSAEGAALATIAKELGAIKRGYRIATRLELVDHAPWIDVPKPHNVREVTPTREEISAILRVLDYLDPPVADGVRWAVLTGWRRTQVFRLRWDDFSDDLDSVTVPQKRTKGRRVHRIPLSLGLQGIALGRLLVARGPHVFHRGGRAVLHFAGAWRRAVDSAGRSELWFHDLRRFFAATATDAGVPIPAQCQIAGWRTDSIHRRYCLLPPDTLRRGVERRTDHLVGQPPGSAKGNPHKI